MKVAGESTSTGTYLVHSPREFRLNMPPCKWLSPPRNCPHEFWCETAQVWKKACGTHVLSSTIFLRISNAIDLISVWDANLRYYVSKLPGECLNLRHPSFRK